MRTIHVVPEDIIIVAEFRLSELKKISRALDSCTIAMNLTDPEQKESHDFFVKNFTDWVNNNIESVEGEDA